METHNLGGDVFSDGLALRVRLALREHNATYVETDVRPDFEALDETVEALASAGLMGSSRRKSRDYDILDFSRFYPHLGLLGGRVVTWSDSRDSSYLSAAAIGALFLAAMHLGLPVAAPAAVALWTLFRIRDRWFGIHKLQPLSEIESEQQNDLLEELLDIIEYKLEALETEREEPTLQERLTEIAPAAVAARLESAGHEEPLSGVPSG